MAGLIFIGGDQDAGTRSERGSIAFLLRPYDAAPLPKEGYRRQVSGFSGLPSSRNSTWGIPEILSDQDPGDLRFRGGPFQKSWAMKEPVILDYPIGLFKKEAGVVPVRQ